MIHARSGAMSSLLIVHECGLLQRTTHSVLERMKYIQAEAAGFVLALILPYNGDLADSGALIEHGVFEITTELIPWQ